jgi:Zinc finger, ZZ type
MISMVTEPGHACLVWLLLLNRLATVENVVHPTICSSCQRENFMGFRYRCQHSRCHGYQMCQDCFWTGKISQNHQNDHEVKEYSCFKSPSKQIGHSLRKSFRCVPEKQPVGAPLPKFPDHPEKTLNLSHIVPPSPLPSHHNGFGDSMYDPTGTLDSRATGRSLDSTIINPGSEMSTRTFNSNEDPHTIMARYAARLAKEGKDESSSSSLNESTTQKTQRELISQLEAKNKEIMREIQRLRQQEQEQPSNQENPQLVSELRALRQRKGELEGHLGALQDSRRQLMQQLEGLMKLLKNHQTQSPRSTPNSSPRSGKSPPIPPISQGKILNL